MKKRSLAVVIMLIAVLLLAACSSKSETKDTSTKTNETGKSETKDTESKDTDTNKEEAKSTSDLKMAWFAPAPHPYFEEVQKGVEKFKAELGIDVIIQIGPDWTQASENEKVEALVAQGVNALSIYPSDASGANGLYEEIGDKAGVNVVNFGSDTSAPSAATSAVATDVKQAAADATEAVIKAIGGKGNILNVLEVLEDPNTALRKEGIEETVAKYPDVKIIQEIAGIKTQEEAVSKIESALSANIGKIDGVICTGLVTSVGMTQTLSDFYEKQGKDKHIYAITIDTDEGVMKGIENGVIDATIAQNPIGQGYISCMILKYLSEGYTMKEDTYFINSGNVLVTKDNISTYADDLDKVTKDIVDKLTTEYMTK